MNPIPRVIRLPLATSPAFGSTFDGALGTAYVERGPHGIDDSTLRLQVAAEIPADADLSGGEVQVVIDGEARAVGRDAIEGDIAPGGQVEVVVDVSIPPGVAWVEFRAVTPAVRDAAEDAVGRPSKLGEVVARQVDEKRRAVRNVARRDFGTALAAWAAAHRARIVVDVDVEGLDEMGREQATVRARESAEKALGALVAHSIDMPGLASTRDRIRQAVASVTSADLGGASAEAAAAVGGLVKLAQQLLDDNDSPITEDDLDDREHQALTRHRRRRRDLIAAEVRQVVRVVGWPDPPAGQTHYDQLPRVSKAEVRGHVHRMAVLDPKGLPVS